MGNAKITHKPSTHVNFHGVAIDGLIKDSYHQFGFVDTNNEPSKTDPTIKGYSTDGGVNGDMILTKLYKRDNLSTADIWKVLSSYNTSSTQKLKYITIDGKLYHQDNT